ncbi:MAG: hypothetical protein EP343_18630 [Deltaproteobacteria bacterium]|nr:MAG: hypothetical protein EP343_18630 [Deltaproteobacteria bacterium]
MVCRRIRQCFWALACFGVSLGIFSHSAVAKPTSMQQQLAQSVGARFVQAKLLAQKGQWSQAIKKLEGLLDEVENGPAAVPVRRQLAKWYMKQKQVKKAKDMLRVAAGPASRPLANTYRKVFARYLHIQLRFRLMSAQGGDLTTKVRRHSFVMSRSKTVTKTFRMNAKGTSVQASLVQDAKAGLQLKGTLVVNGKKRPFQVGPFVWKNAQAQERRVSRVRLSVAATTLDIKLRAVLSHKLGRGPRWNLPGTPPPPRPPARRTQRSVQQFSMKLRKVTVKNVLKILADMNGYKITYKGDIDGSRTVSLKIKAKLRKNLLKLSCARMGIKCEVKGDKLHITMPPRTTPPPTPPAPPSRTGGRPGNPPSPPKPPRR